MKKKMTIICIILFTMLISGCADKHLTLIYFESYAELENPEGEYHSGDEYIFEFNDSRYKVMNGYLASRLQIIEDDKENRYKLIMVDSDMKELFSMTTEKEYDIEAIRECTDNDGKVYILYSKWDTYIGNLFIEDLKSSYILEMDMDSYKVTNQYNFGESVVVLTVNNGYVYTMEDGRVYRELLGNTGNNECMSDLGFRGTPNVAQIRYLTFSIEQDGIKVIATVPDDENKYCYKDVVLSNIKYTDNPIESFMR